MNVPYRVQANGVIHLALWEKLHIKVVTVFLPAHLFRSALTTISQLRLEEAWIFRGGVYTGECRWVQLGLHHQEIEESPAIDCNRVKEL